jgi:hypothetical protein
MNSKELDPADNQPATPTQPRYPLMPLPPKLPVNRPKYLLDTQKYQIPLADDYQNEFGGEL